MPALTRNLSVSARSLVCLALLSQASLAFGNITPLPRNSTDASGAAVSVALPRQEVESTDVLDRLNVASAAMPVVEIAPAPSQGSAPASVPLPPAIETGLSGGAALILAAGLRKLRRFIRRGF